MITCCFGVVMRLGSILHPGYVWTQVVKNGLRPDLETDLHDFPSGLTEVARTQ